MEQNSKISYRDYRNGVVQGNVLTLPPYHEGTRSFMRSRLMHHTTVTHLLRGRRNYREGHGHANPGPATTAYKWWNCQVIGFLDGFPDPRQIAAAKLTYYSSKPQRPSDSSRSWLRILLSGDVHPNLGPTTKYPCPVCDRNVTGRGVSFRSDLVFKTQQSTDALRTGYVALAAPHPLYRNHYQHQFNTSCRWEFIHHHAIQRKWHRQQTDGIE